MGKEKGTSEDIRHWCLSWDPKPACMCYPAGSRRVNEMSHDCCNLLPVCPGALFGEGKIPLSFSLAEFSQRYSTAIEEHLWFNRRSPVRAEQYLRPVSFKGKNQCAQILFVSVGKTPYGISETVTDIDMEQ